MALVAGSTFGGYTVLRLLGVGGMGEVYLVRHPRLPRKDALKILTERASDDTDRDRFLREADLAAELWHPNIVRVNDRGEFEGRLWIAMDFVEGTDAGKQLQERYAAGMPIDQVVAIVGAIASALDYAHGRGLLHRDVKPSNILIANAVANDDRILLGDFGIATEIGVVSGLTATNFTVGTLAYAAPEQLMGDKTDGRADQYALAASAYHLLTGSQPYPHSNPAVVISRHLNAPVPTLAHLRPELTSLDPILAAAMAKKSQDRFASCTDFAQALAETASTQTKPVVAVAPTTPAPVARKPNIAPGIEPPVAANADSPPIDPGWAAGMPTNADDRFTSITDIAYVPTEAAPAQTKPVVADAPKTLAPVASMHRTTPRASSSAPARANRSTRRWMVLSVAAVSVLLVGAIGVLISAIGVLSQSGQNTQSDATATSSSSTPVPGSSAPDMESQVVIGLSMPSGSTLVDREVNSDGGVEVWRTPNSLSSEIQRLFDVLPIGNSLNAIQYCKVAGPDPNLVEGKYYYRSWRWENSYEFVVVGVTPGIIDGQWSQSTSQVILTHARSDVGCLEP